VIDDSSDAFDMDIDIDDDAADTYNTTIGKKHKNGTNTSNTNQQQQQQQAQRVCNAWTKQEDALLIQGVAMYGNGHWTAIRTNTGLNRNSSQVSCTTSTLLIKLHAAAYRRQ
jgi:Myb-like DNA-binding domain